MKIFYGEFDFKFNPFEGDEGYVLQFLFQHWKYCFRFKVAGISIRSYLDFWVFKLRWERDFPHPPRTAPPPSLLCNRYLFFSYGKSAGLWTTKPLLAQRS